ncbi:MAG: tetratricopeptide repeat protein, partial [Actinobacteria bacterium]|nr:tetratricopeptide repeat protein [Actinomycetota bacterium]
MATFSVLMPAYNHEEYVAEAIESVLGQTFGDLELIVIDDCSRDATPDIVRRYAAADSRVRAYFHFRNQGISRTLNEALDLAEGRFVAVINSDDFWMPEKLMRQWEVLRENENLVVWTEGALVDAQGKRVGQTFTACYHAESKMKSGDIFDELIQGNYVLHTSIALKREIMAKFGYDESLRYNNDFRLFLDLAAECLYCFLPDELVGYRVHGGNAIFHHGREWEDDYLRMYAGVLDRYGGRIANHLKAKVYLFCCRLFDKRGMRSNAARLLSRALAMDPDNPSVLFKALCLCDGLRRCDHFWAMEAGGSEGRTRKTATRHLNAGEKKVGGDGLDGIEAVFSSGLELALRGELSEALARFEWVLEVDRGAAGAWVNAAVVRSMMGDNVGALACAEAALEAGGMEAQAEYCKGVILEYAEDTEEAALCFKRVIGLLEEGGDRAMLSAAEMGLGVCVAATGSFEEAVEHMERAARLNPVDARPYFNRAFCLELVGRYEEAVDLYDEASRRSRNPRWETLRKGLCLECLGRFREAARCFDEMLRIDPRDDEAWLEKGGCFERQGDREKALACYEKASRANPVNAEAWRRKGAMLASMDDPEGAVACFREALRLDYRDPEILVEAASACMACGEYGEAEALFRKALEEDDSSAGSWLGLAICRERRGEHMHALEYVDEAIARDPGFAEAWNEKGNILSLAGATREARYCYLRALEADEGMAEAWFNLAAVEEE